MVLEVGGILLGCNVRYVQAWVQAGLCNDYSAAGTLLFTLHLQGFMLKFSAGFSQAWAKMIDVEGGLNPLVKDVALDSTGYIFTLITYEQLDGTKVGVQWCSCYLLLTVAADDADPALRSVRGAGGRI